MHRIQKFTLSARKAPSLAGSRVAPAKATASTPTIADPIAAVMDQVEAELPRLLTPLQVADVLGLTERTLERWRITGEGPRFSKLSRSTVRYLREDVAAFVTDRLRANTAQ